MKEWKKFATNDVTLTLQDGRKIGAKKTFVFCSLVVVMSTIMGFLFGMLG